MIIKINKSFVFCFYEDKVEFKYISQAGVLYNYEPKRPEIIICAKCGSELPANQEYFYISKNEKYSLRPICKRCSTKYARANRIRINAQYRENPKLRLNRNISNGIRLSLKEKKNGRKWESLIGYSLDGLINRLESQFQPNMNWANYGRDGWEIDHIIPVSAFNFDSMKCIDFHRCWALNNLRPLWAKENRRKHTKLINDFQPGLHIEV